jgi:lipoprotein NlpD
MRVGCVTLCGVLLLSACGSTMLNRAPVEDRGQGVPSGGAAESKPIAASAKPAPGFENAGKPGYYTVKPGDTLIRIGLDAGQSHKDIARWNALDNPNRIEVGQVLRIVAPVSAESAAVVTKPVSSGSAVGTPIVPTVGGSVVPAVASASAKVASSPVGSASAPAAAATPAVTAAGDDEIHWAWPHGGQVVAGFDEAKNKGLDIAGSAGDPVLAAAEGKVVYAGAGLRGYGNLIILKHNGTYLSAYAHNKAILVKEDQTVKRGQKIAEMGDSDADRTKLHFEVRRQGKPVDPARYLPNR